jgi:hypothetical protein
MHRRRATIGQILQQMLPADRAQLATVLNRFAAAGGEPEDADLWAVGWTTESPAGQQVPARGDPDQLERHIDQGRIT